MGWKKKRRDDDVPYEQRVARVLREHLPPEEVPAALAVLRPALQLVPAGGGETVVARLGGNARLALGAEWPVWPEHGPLSYVGEVFCSALAGTLRTPQLPPSGRLLFFYYDGSYDDGETFVAFWDPASLAGVRAVWVPHGIECDEVPSPEGLDVFGEALLAGTPVVTSPDEEATALPPDLADAIDNLVPGPKHRIGGYPYPMQGPVEDEVARLAVATRPDAAATVEEEAKRWELVFQVASDDSLDMMWGDGGLLYWLARAGEPVVAEELLFTWQCG